MTPAAMEAPLFASTTPQFPVTRLGSVLHHRKEVIQIDDTARYKRCRVQVHAAGIVLRDEVSGLEINSKRQQVCRPGEFLVAEIDAKDGGFGIVPDLLAGATAAARAARRREYRPCRFCGGHFPLDHRLDRHTCHACASHHIGVVF